MSPADSDDLLHRLLLLDSAIQTMKTADRIVIAQPQVVDGDEAAAKTEDVPLPVGEIDELVRTLEGLQAAARYEFNVRARPRLRKLSLLDLPDELLLEIFDCFKGWVDSDQEFYHINLEVDTRSIQNSRLTCRRLCDISSHLLVPCVYVIPTLSSLEFLKQVTSHPKISRGTRVFRIDASFYGARIANDIRRFAVLCSRKVREDIQHLEREIRDWGDDDDDSCDDDASEVHGPESMQADIESYRRMLSSWDPFRSGQHVTDHTQLDAAALALLKGHERYRELFEQQEKVLSDGIFSRKIAEAAASSRKNVWLCISDTPSFRRAYKPLWRLRIAYPDLPADEDRVVRSLVPQTLEWYTAQGENANRVPRWLLYELPLEMRAAGASLVGFRVNISTPCRLSLSLSSEQLDDLREAAQNLKFFGFDFGGASLRRSYLTRTTEQMAGLYSYLSAAMGQQSAPTLSMGLGGKFSKVINSALLNPENPTTTSARPISPELFSIGPLLTSSSWSRVKLIRLHNISLHLDQLKKLVDMLQPGVRIDFFDLYLMSGTWAEGLDCLRSKAGLGSSFLLPHGAECENMTTKDYFHIFEDSLRPSEPRNLSTRYIISIDGVGNPLRKRAEATGVDLRT